MKIRTKLAKRLLIVALVFVSLMAAGGGFYAYRKIQIRAKFERYRLDGLAAAAAGDNQRAVDLLGAYLQRYPDKNAEAMIAYARVRPLIPSESHDHLRSSIFVLRQLLKTYPKLDLTPQRRQLLKLYVQTHLWAEALATADVLVPAGPTLTRDDATVMEARAKAAYSLRNFGLSLECARQWVKLDPQNLEGQFLVLETANRTGQYSETSPADSHAPTNEIELAEQLITAAHNDQDATGSTSRLAVADSDEQKARDALVRGHASVIAKNYDAAIRQLSLAAKGPLPDARLAVIFVSELDQLGLGDESMTVLRRLEANSHDPAVSAQIARRLWENGDAQATCDQIAKLDLTKPTADAELIALHGLAESTQKHLLQAKAIRDQLAARPTTDTLAVAWAAILDALAQPHNIDRPHLAALCEKALETYKSPYLAYTLGEIDAENGDRDAALKRWQSSAQWSSTWFAPLLRSAEVLSQAGKHQEAIQAAQEAFRRRHNGAVVFSNVRVIEAAFEAGVVRDPSGLLDFIDKELLPKVNDDGRLLCTRVNLMAATGHRDQAIAAAKTALDASKAISEESLARLIIISNKRQLGDDIEKACRDKIQRDYGSTPDQALAQATDVLNAGKPQDATRQFEAARAGAREPNLLSWRIAWAHLLDRSGDPRAQAEMQKLADAEPKDLAVQIMATEARYTRDDRPFIERTIGRIHDLVGDGVMWQVARGRMLLQFASSNADVQQAVTLLQKATQSEPNLLAARLLLADAYNRLKRSSDTAEQLKVAISIDPNSAQLGLQYAESLRKTGNFAGSREELTRISKLPSINPALQIAAARVATNAGDIPFAMGFVANLQGAPGDVSDALFLAQLKWRGGQPDQAEVDFDRLLRDPECVPAVMAAGADFFRTRGNQSRVQELLERLNTDKKHPGLAQFEQARFALRSSGPAAALDCFTRATSADTTIVPAWLGMVDTNLTLGRVDEAKATVTKAAAAVPRDQKLTALAAHADWLSHWNTAPELRPFIRSFVQDPTSDAAAASIQALVAARSPSKQPAQLVADVDQLIQQFPDFLPLHMRAIELLAGSGHLSEAQDRASRASQLFPASIEPQIVLVAILRQEKRPRDALGEALKWRSRSLANPLPADLQIAQSDIELELFDDAIQQLEPYAHIAATNPDAYQAAIPIYALAQHHLGKTDVPALVQPLLDLGPRGRLAYMAFASSELDGSEATQSLSRAEQAIPPDALDERIMLARMWDNLYRHSHDKSDGAQARKILSALTDKAEVSGVSWLTLGMFDEADANANDAQASYRKAIEQLPEWSQDRIIAQNNLAMVLAQNGGDLSEAANLATAAIKLAPDAAPLHDTLAFVEQKRQHYPDAAASALNAVRLAPRTVQYRVRLARALLSGKKLTEAQAAIHEMDSIQLDAPSETEKRDLDALKAELDASAPRANG